MRPRGFKWYLSVVLPVLALSGLVLFTVSASRSSSSMDCCSEIECNGKKEACCSESYKDVKKILQLPLGDSVYVESGTTDVRCGYKVELVAGFWALDPSYSTSECPEPSRWEKLRPVISISMKTQGPGGWKRLPGKWIFDYVHCAWSYKYEGPILWEKGDEITPTTIIVKVTYEKPVFTLPANIPGIALPGIYLVGPKLPEKVGILVFMKYKTIE